MMQSGTTQPYDAINKINKRVHTFEGINHGVHNTVKIT